MNSVGLFVSDTQDPRLFTQTKAGQILQGPSLEATRLFKTGKSIVILNGDTCRPGQYIIIQGTGNRSINIARLEEILQEVGSDAYNQGKADALLVQILDITGTSERLRMPQLSTANCYILMRTDVSMIQVFL
jgi:hypothetical protein